MNTSSKGYYSVHAIEEFMPFANSHSVLVFGASNYKAPKTFPKHSLFYNICSPLIWCYFQFSRSSISQCHRKFIVLERRDEIRQYCLELDAHICPRPHPNTHPHRKKVDASKSKHHPNSIVIVSSYFPLTNVQAFI